MIVLISIGKVKCIVCGFNGIDLKSHETFFPSFTYNKTDDVRPFNCPNCKAELELHYKSQFEIKQKYEK